MRSSRKWFVVAVPMFALGYATVGCTFEAGVDVPGTGGAPPSRPQRQERSRNAGRLEVSSTRGYA